MGKLLNLNIIDLCDTIEVSEYASIAIDLPEETYVYIAEC